MAISQSNYVDITSAVAGASSLGSPSLSHRRITKSKLKDAEGVELANGEILTVTYSMLGSLAEFLTEKDQAFANQYFSIRTTAPASKPKALQFVYADNTDLAVVDAYLSARAKNKDYGSFSIEGLESESEAELLKLKSAHMATNVEHQLLVPLSTAVDIETLPVYTAFKGVPMTAFVLSVKPGEHKEVIPAGLIDATDFEGTNTVNQIMYRQASGMTADVDSDAAKNTLDSLGVNFYGKTSQDLSFFQRGTLQGTSSDPRDIMTAAGEQWLKGKIAADLLSALVSSRIPGNLDGVARIRALIENGAIASALKSGVIMRLKTLTPLQSEAVADVSGDPLAAADVYSAGYWLGVEIRTEVVNGVEEKHAHYVLLYSKADFVRKIVGSHNLI